MNGTLQSETGEMKLSLLSKVSTGVVKRPHYILMHGLPGLGKSTFASKAPKPIFLCAEKGTNHLDVSRLELNTFPDFLQAIKELETSSHDFKTVVIDTVDHIEPLIFKEVCRDQGKSSIEQIGYAKGYIFALEYWKQFVEGLERLRDRGMNVVILAHTEIKTFQDPQLAEGYDRYQVKLHQKAANFIIDRVECVLFANYETYLKTDDGSKTKAFGDGARVLYTEHRPAFVAKNRFGLKFKLPLEWDDFAAGCEAPKTEGVIEFKKAIEELLPQVKDPELKKRVEKHLSEIGDDAKKLSAALNKLKTIVAA
jgi:ribosomal protein L14E/L6E/L27E